MVVLPPHKHGKTCAMEKAFENALDGGKAVFYITPKGLMKFRRKKHLTLIMKVNDGKATRNETI